MPTSVGIFFLSLILPYSSSLPNKRSVEDCDGGNLSDQSARRLHRGPGRRADPLENSSPRIGIRYQCHLQSNLPCDAQCGFLCLHCPSSYHCITISYKIVEVACDTVSCRSGYSLVIIYTCNGSSGTMTISSS